MKIVVSMLLIFAVITTKAQRAQSVYFELFGPGLASVNYDVRFDKKPDGLGMRLGIGGWFVSNESITTIPLGVNYLVGDDRRHFFEVGVNYTYLIYNRNNYYNNNGTFTASFGTLNFGYRSQPKDKGFQFRAGANPIITKDGIFPFYLGLSFGYKF